MKSTFKRLVASTAFLAAGAASAASVTVATGTGVYNGVTYTGAGALTFSADLLAALDTAKIDVTGYGAATALVEKDSEDYYIFAAASAPITALTIDDANGQVLSAATSGGATMTATTLIRSVIGLGGSLTVTDLNVDLVNKLVYGTISGNGLAAKTEALWTIGSITGATALSGPGSYSTTFSGLKLTPTALDDFSIALKLASLGKTTLGAVENFGTITSTIMPAIPEPSTYALMGLGLVGMGLAARRRAK